MSNPAHIPPSPKEPMDAPSSRQSDHSASHAESNRPRQTEQTAAPTVPISVFVYGLILAAGSAAIFLAGRANQGSLGIFLVCAGVALTIFPAPVRVEWSLWAAVTALLGCGSLAFLPARWFALPGWRENLAAAPAIHLPPTVTPVPWETGFWLAILGLSCLTGLFLLAHPIRSRAVLWIAVSAVGVCGLYATLSIYARQTGWHYPFSGGATFGFFPNRNHTATFLVTGSILALGVLTIGLREGRWTLSALAAAAMAACVAGLFFYSGSRGGVIFLTIGTLVWVGGLGGTHRNLPLVVSVAALAVAAGILFLMAGGEARSRLLGTGEPNAPAKSATDAGSTLRTSVDPLPGNQNDTPFDFRLLIYRDTFALVKDAPVTGTGLGAFAPVFAQYRRASLSAGTSIHPESDWLMLTAEAGVPALAFALLAGGLLLLRLRGAHQHPYWPLRWACAAAALVAMLHGIVDVPAHRVALGWWILLLACMGAQAGSRRNEKAGIIQRTLFILGGLAAMALGLQLIRAEWFGGKALPPFAATSAEDKILATFNRGDAWAAMKQAQAAVEVSPMASGLYFQLGVLLLHFEDSDAEADEAFKAQRVLNRTWPSVPLLQGDAFATIDQKKTATLWLEALDRQIQLDHAPGVIHGTAAAFYRGLLDRGRTWPDVQRQLIGAVDQGPDFLVAWLDGATAELAREQLPVLSARTDLLAQLTPVQREKFLFLWYSKGDRAELTQFLDKNASWQASAWLVRLYQLLAARQFDQAVRAACEHYQVSLALPSQVAPVGDTGDSEDPIARLNGYWTAGNTAMARRALDEPAESTGPNPLPPEYWRLKASLAVNDQNWPLAWRNLKLYLQPAHPSDALP